MKGSYKLSPEAENDLYRIWLYGVERWGVDAADRYYAAFFERFEVIAANPRQYLVYPCRRCLSLYIQCILNQCNQHGLQTNKSTVSIAANRNISKLSLVDIADRGNVPADVWLGGSTQEMVDINGLNI